MKQIITIIVAVLVYPVIYGQSISELYKSKDYPALIKLEDKGDTLTTEELFMVGYAFFQLENDEKAVIFYDKAIAKGFDNGPIHYYKSQSLTYLKKYKDALKEVDLAMEKEPNNQEYMNQKGLIYQDQGLEDKALDYFDEATRLPNTLGEPYFWVAYIYHGKQDLEKALKYYYIAAEKIPKENPYYVNTLLCIGQLEYTYTQNYSKSALAYAEAVAMRPKEYGNYPKLIKACNAAKEYTKADAVFDLMKTAYKNNELPKADMELKYAAIDEYEYNRQKLIIYKSFEDPTKVLDTIYKIYLFNKTEDKPARRFTVEKTIQVAKGLKYILCEVKENEHLTYPYGWKTDSITLEDLKQAVGQILNGKLQKTATSK